MDKWEHFEELNYSVLPHMLREHCPDANSRSTVQYICTHLYTFVIWMYVLTCLYACIHILLFCLSIFSLSTSEEVAILLLWYFLSLLHLSHRHGLKIVVQVPWAPDCPVPAGHHGLLRPGRHGGVRPQPQGGAGGGRQGTSPWPNTPSIHSKHGSPGSPDSANLFQIFRKISFW